MLSVVWRAHIIQEPGGEWSNLMASHSVLKCSIVSKAKKHGVPGIKDYPSRVQGFGGKYSGEVERAVSPKDYISVPGSQSEACQTEQEIVSLSVKMRREKCKWPSSNGRLICNPGCVPWALPVHHLHLVSKSWL